MLCIHLLNSNEKKKITKPTPQNPKPPITPVSILFICVSVDCLDNYTCWSFLIWQVFQNMETYKLFSQCNELLIISLYRDRFSSSACQIFPSALQPLVPGALPPLHWLQHSRGCFSHLFPPRVSLWTVFCPFLNVFPKAPPPCLRGSAWGGNVKFDFILAIRYGEWPVQSQLPSSMGNIDWDLD